ncbi:MAG: 50S ribosomal protein L29 [bacterium]|nr:50S ribosomal protein L29 [bacterium]
MKIQEIRKKSVEDLRKMLGEFRENVRGLRFKIASREVKNHQLLRVAKKDIAKILTVLKERISHGS